MLAYGAESDRVLGVPGEVCFFHLETFFFSYTHATSHFLNNLHHSFKCHKVNSTLDETTYTLAASHVLNNLIT